MYLSGWFEWDRTVEDRVGHCHGYFITEVNMEKMLDEMRIEKIQVGKRGERKEERKKERKKLNERRIEERPVERGEFEKINRRKYI